MVVGGCCTISHLRSDTVGIVITEHCAIPPPGDSGDRTTSGGAGEGEHRKVSGQVCVQLEGDITWDSNLPCWWKRPITQCGMAPMPPPIVSVMLLSFTRISSFRKLSLVTSVYRGELNCHLQMKEQ